MRSDSGSSGPVPAKMALTRVHSSPYANCPPAGCEALRVGVGPKAFPPQKLDKKESGRVCIKVRHTLHREDGR